MCVLWQSKPPLKPAEVQHQLGTNQAYTTIMTVLTRMVEKKLLKRKLIGKAFHYSTVIPKEEYVKNNLKNIYGNLVSSYGKTAISNFVDVIKNNQEDMALLKEYLKNQK